MANLLARLLDVVTADLYAQYNRVEIASYEFLSGTLTLAHALVHATALFLVLPRIWKRPYRGFSIVLVSEIGDEHNLMRLTFGQRCELVFHILWRELVAGGIAAVVSGAISWAGLPVPSLFYVMAGVLAVGPIIMKMIIGTPLSGFFVTVRRSSIVLTSPAAQP